jgi:glycosyltransferase involved in cell wall biosynthesis
MSREAVATHLTPRIALACSGLGHIKRGIEAWAQDLGSALVRRGEPVTLFGGAQCDIPGLVPVGCWKRTSPAAQWSAKLLKHLGGWRYYAGSPYDIEQMTFSIALWRRIRADYDLLHVQDPAIAGILNRLHRAGLSRPRVILANGTGESEEKLGSFPIVQHLTPISAAGAGHAARPGQSIFTVPNFIDVGTFGPARTGEDRAAVRRRLGIGEADLVVLCCAAIRRYHKRIDYLIEEFGRFLETGPTRPTTLVVAGGREQDTDELIGLAKARLGDRVRILVNCPRGDMPALYGAADVFAITSLFETFGIVLLEAMASGLPILCHDTPTFRFVAGSAALYSDLSRTGALCEALTAISDPERRTALAAAAVPHVTAQFSETIVIDQILRMYRTVMKDVPHALS